MYSNAKRNSVALALGALLLFLVNFAIASRLFHLEFANHMGSVEALFIGLTRFFSDHGYSLTWFPYWYGGIPLHNTYPPGLMWLCMAAVKITGCSAARAYHFVIGLEYCLGPVTAYLLASVLSKRVVASFLAGLFYSLINLSAVFITEVGADVGGHWLSRRIQVLEPYGEGPHILTLVLLPLAILALHKALTKPRPVFYGLAIFAVAAVLLSNVMGALAILFGVYAYLVSRDEFFLSDWVYTFAIGVAAYAITSIWIPPSTVALMGERAKFVGGDYTALYQMAPIVYPMLFISVWALAYLLRKMRVDSSITFFLSAFSFFAFLALPAYWRNISFSPMPKRYHVELDLLLPFAIAIALSFLPWKKLPRAFAGIFALSILIATIFQVVHLRKQVGTMSASIDIAKTSEYKIAKQLNTYGMAGRVFVPGSSETWLMAFSDLRQFGGAFVQVVPSQNVNVGSYVILSSDGGAPNLPSGILWLQAFGVARVATTGPGSTDPYQAFQNPDKFKGVLKELWRDGGDAIFEVPHRTESLVHVLPKEALVSTVPVNGIDTPEIARYVDALTKETRDPSVQWQTPGLAHIKANVQPGDAISLQTTYGPGWNARIGGEKIAVEADGIGLMKILPNRSGPIDLTLEYNGGTEAAVTQALGSATLFGTILIAGILEWRKRNHAHRN